jgi:hypothetical protein
LKPTTRVEAEERIMGFSDPVLEQQIRDDSPPIVQPLLSYLRKELTDLSTELVDSV